MDSGQNSTRLSKKKLTLILFKFCKIETEGTLTNYFYEVIIILIPKLYKDPRKKIVD